MFVAEPLVAMRTRLQIATPRPSDIVWSEEDDDTFNRTRAAITDALDALDLPEDTPEEDTIKILRLPDAF
jgi:hypothetical protein